MEEKGAILSHDLIIVVAKRFYGMKKRGPFEKELQFFHGWFQRFKKHFGIKGFTRHGKDAFVDNSSRYWSAWRKSRVLYQGRMS